MLSQPVSFTFPIQVAGLRQVARVPMAEEFR
jgi:hypothetical protein